MFEFNEVALNQIIVHHVGNKTKEEKLRFSKSVLQLDEPVKDLLLQYFLSPFKVDAFYSFSHESDVNLNDVYTCVSRVFDNPESFQEQSTHLAQRLFDITDHPRIKSGEFYVAYLENVVVDDELVDAVGLFKSENKDTYLKVFQRNDNFEIDYENGININRLDKGCLIFNTEKDLGYKVCIVDNLSRSGEARFWRKDFLNLEERHDDFYMTQNHMKVCKAFVSDVYNQENEVERPDQIDFLNKSMQYFKDKEQFDSQEFNEQVLQDKNTIAAFSEFQENYVQENEIELEKQFDISDEAVKRGKGQFKSVLKLDKNFHVYIHGSRDRVVKGYDSERDLHFYQLFYNNES